MFMINIIINNRLDSLNEFNCMKPEFPACSGE
jgi:hypothetical protein